MLYNQDVDLDLEAEFWDENGTWKCVCGGNVNEHCVADDGSLGECRRCDCEQFTLELLAIPTSVTDFPN